MLQYDIEKTNFIRVYADIDLNIKWDVIDFRNDLNNWFKHKKQTKKSRFIKMMVQYDIEKINFIMLLCSYRPQYQQQNQMI